MTPLLEPFTGYLPVAEFAHRVVGPPMSMLDPDQRDAARLDPLSFRHVAGRGAGTSKEEAEEWVRQCHQAGVFRHIGPAVLVYQLAKGDLVATGLIADVSVAAYDQGLIERHETTIAKTEEKMADYMKLVRIYGNPVALAHRHDHTVSATIASTARRTPDLSFVAADGFAHSVWIIEADAAAAVCESFTETLYITDGHHRLAAASRVAAEEGRPHPYLPAGLFSADELRIRSFARCVYDPDVDLDDVIRRLSDEHEMEEVEAGEARPRFRHEFGVRVGDRWFRLRIDPVRVPDDIYASLDVNLLQDLVLEPVFGIDNPRRDQRLHFSADLPDLEGPNTECEAWFLPFPASVHDVMAVADAGLVMPPKSTWFAPKLPSGMVVRLLDKPR